VFEDSNIFTLFVPDEGYYVPNEGYYVPNEGYKHRLNYANKNTTHYALDTTMRKQTQIT
jgi:hypothetical protein